MSSVFTPCFILPSELQAFGLSTPDVQPDIVNVVQLASTLLDQECGRIDGDGNGSLIFTTYTQRILLQTRNRNLVEIPMKPIAAVDANTVALIQASGAAIPGQNYYDTGVQANTQNGPNGDLTGILSCSGRYGYIRQDRSVGYPDLFAAINPLNLITMFGGPAPWVSMDVTQIDYDKRTGEAWLPAGIQLQAYSEILITYNSGFSPLQIPWALKHVTASLTKNALAKGDGTTGLLTMTLGRSGANATFFQQLLDPTLDRMITPYRNVRSY